MPTAADRAHFGRRFSALIRQRTVDSASSSPRECGTEDSVPKLSSNAEIAWYRCEMVQRVTPLDPIQIRVSIECPMVDHIVQAHVPEVTKHDSRRHSAREIKPDFPP